MGRPKPDEKFVSIPMVVSWLDNDVATCIAEDYFVNVMEPGIIGYFDATLKAVKQIRRDWRHDRVTINRNPEVFDAIVNEALNDQFFLRECPPEILTLANLLRGLDLMFKRLVGLNPGKEKSLNARINFALTVT